MDKAATNQLISVSNPSQIAEPAGRLAILATLTTILLLATLHVLSPEFSPSWRMVSEYAFGHYAWVLSLMFVSWAISSWALVIVIWSQVHTNAGRVGLWFLIIAGIGEAMASVFDVRHEIGHGIAGLLGVIGFPIAALLLSGALGRNLARVPQSPRMDREPKLDQCRPARGDADNHDDANGANLRRPFAATCAGIAAARGACSGWVGEPPDRVVQLRMGTRCCVACDSGAA